MERTRRVKREVLYLMFRMLGLGSSTGIEFTAWTGQSNLVVLKYFSTRKIVQLQFYNGVWLSLVERYVRDVEVAGSNPVTPIPRKQKEPRLSIRGSFYFFEVR